MKTVPASPSGGALPLEQNLAQFLANAGIGSRRQVSDFLRAGMVTVNGMVERQGSRVIQARTDAVKCNSKRIMPVPLVYILLHKPLGVVSTLDDPENRPTVLGLLRGVRERVYPVGRLDYNTTGVMLLTNDGDLALRLTHPRFGFQKTYHAHVEGVPSESAIHKLRLGVRIPNAGGVFEKSQPAEAHFLGKSKQRGIIALTVREGRKHQVRKMCQAIGHPVRSLQRVKFGFLTAKGLAPGAWRYMTPDEITRLQAFARKAGKEQPRP
jgi:pseudouridine synthase